MALRRRAIGGGLIGAGLGGLAGAWAPSVRAAGDAAAGARDRRVQVMSTTDRVAVQPLIDDFERRHAGLRVEYLELGSVALYERFLRDVGRAGEGPDVLWSSAMDLQIKLVNDANALRYESPHATRLPRWAVWKHEAYGTTQEPVGIVYNPALLAGSDAPRTHTALTALLLADSARFRGRVATYDIERAGLGFLIAAQDAMANPRYWDLVQALGLCQARLHADTQSMLGDVASGRSLLAVNVLGTYAEAFARGNPGVGVGYFGDYTLLVSRVAFIARNAPNPQGAKLWLDHLLSREGQQLLADAAGLTPVRADAAPPRSGAALRPIVLGPGLLAHLDRSTREAFLKRWRREFLGPR